MLIRPDISLRFLRSIITPYSLSQREFRRSFIRVISAFLRLLLRIMYSYSRARSAFVLVINTPALHDREFLGGGTSFLRGAPSPANFEFAFPRPQPRAIHHAHSLLARPTHYSLCLRLWSTVSRWFARAAVNAPATVWHLSLIRSHIYYKLILESCLFWGINLIILKSNNIKISKEICSKINR